MPRARRPNGGATQIPPPKGDGRSAISHNGEPEWMTKKLPSKTTVRTLTSRRANDTPRFHPRQRAAVLLPKQTAFMRCVMPLAIDIMPQIDMYDAWSTRRRATRQRTSLLMAIVKARYQRNTGSRERSHAHTLGVYARVVVKPLQLSLKRTFVGVKRDNVNNDNPTRKMEQLEREARRRQELPYQVLCVLAGALHIPPPATLLSRVVVSHLCFANALAATTTARVDLRAAAANARTQHSGFWF